MSEFIEYTLNYSYRKSMKIEVKENEEIIITVPINCSKEEVDKLIQKKKKWILDKIDIIRNREKLNKDEILYLGDKKKVKINVQKYIKREFVVYDNDTFIINVKNEENIIKIIKRYFNKELSEIIKERINIYQGYFVEIPKKISIRDMKSIWGSCSRDNSLSFNLKLIMAPIEVIDYVIIHEMCHMKEKNHSKKYWSEVGKILPDYQKEDCWLKDKAYLLHFLHLQP